MINTKRLINNFVTTAKIYSPTGSEDTLRDFLVSLLKDLVDIVKVDKYGNIYCRVNGTSDPIFLAAHMDTVEPCKGVKPVVLGDKITSDGTTILGADNKVAIACFIELIMILNEKKVPHKTIEFVFTRSEEVGNYGAINFDCSNLTSKIGYCFDSIAPVGTIITASPFYEAVDIKMVGTQLHASIATEDQNLIKIVSEFIQEMNLGKVGDDTLVNIGILQTGFARNTVPGEVSMKGEIRSYSYKNIVREKKKIDVLLNKISKKYGIKSSAQYIKENDGYIHESGTVEEMIKQSERIFSDLNIKSKRLSSWAVSDANIFNNLGLVCLNMGDGVVNAHSNEEHIKIAELNLLANTMLSLVQYNYE